MKYKKITYYLLPLLGALTLSGCALSESGTFEPQEPQGELKLNLTGDISQVYQTRANDSGFCDQDEIGIYVVDFDAEGQAQRLKTTGNRADNLKHIFDEASYKWNPLHDIYWKDSKTHVDIYGYYPFQSIQDVDAQSFEVQKDQSRAAEHGRMGGYEASDFLWGKVADVSPTDRVIRVSMGHRMASVRVSLVEGQGFDSGEWVDARKDVLILNTRRNAVIDLSTGSVSASGEVQEKGILPYLHGDDFRAIVVPQTIESNVPLLSITVGGTAYTFKKAEQMTYIPGKQHNFTVTVNKKQSGEYEFTLSGESITAWENDNVSHDVTAREYIVIDVPEAGTLDKCIEAAGKDLTKVENLKVTGNINARDFYMMKDQMTLLKSLNLKEVIIVKCDNGEDLEIPQGALSEKFTLVNLVLPDKLRVISGSAFSNCKSLTGSLNLPEGLIKIGKAAFFGCSSINGTLTLPSTLEYIGEEKGYIGYWDGAFKDCNFVGELKLPDGLKGIGMGSFMNCKGLYGELRLPEKLEYIGEMAFADCSGLIGTVEIPQGVTVIRTQAFAHCGFNGNLILHDGITTIFEEAFVGSPFRGELKLPKNLEVIGKGAFHGCDFSGELVLPKGLRAISEECFASNWRLMGVVEIPDNVQSIGSAAFANCRSLEGVIFPEALESIGCRPNDETGGAFYNCFGINKIVCKGAIPPYVKSNAFNGVPKDNFTVEVPENAVVKYQAEEGWKDFKRISAYRNLVIRPNVATAINTSVTRDLVLNADDEWEVESQPDWVTLDRTSGKGKTELQLTFSQMPVGYDREGDLVFKLKDRDYRTTCHLTQYDYQYAEDEVLTLQSASKGNGKINVVILGDGYNAEDVSEGNLLKNTKEAADLFFAIEPYKSYKEYFNIYTAISVSPESGVGNINTIIYNRFNTTAKGSVTLSGRNGDSDFDEIMRYASKCPTVDDSTMDQTLVIMIPNTEDYGGITYMYDGGFAIAYCPMSDYGYPLDFRGVVQHEAGGHGFGKLGDEYIYHNAFIDACQCTCCDHEFEFNCAKAKGWYDNLSLTGKMNEVPWAHLIFDEKYSQYVDIFEGGFMHSRGVYRSEYNSCMNNDIPYYSTISRESIVKRIKRYAGEDYSFDEFKANDLIENTPVTTKSADLLRSYVAPTRRQQSPVFMGERPHIN